MHRADPHRPRFRCRTPRVSGTGKSDLRDHQAIVQPRLCDCLTRTRMATQITLKTESIPRDQQLQVFFVMCSSGWQDSTPWGSVLRVICVTIKQSYNRGCTVASTCHQVDGYATGLRRSLFGDAQCISPYHTCLSSCVVQRMRAWPLPVLLFLSLSEPVCRGWKTLQGSRNHCPSRVRPTCLVLYLPYR